MDILAILLLILTTCCVPTTDANSLCSRHKRFVVQSDAASKNIRYPTPTTYPVPTIRNGYQQSSEQLLSSANPQPGANAKLSGSDLLNSIAVKCPVKRSAGIRRVFLDEQLMQELYLSIIRNIERSGDVGISAADTRNFRRTTVPSPMNKTRLQDHTKNLLKSAFVKEMRKYRAWFDSILSDLGVSNDAPTTNSNLLAALRNPADRLDAILYKTNITKSQLKQLLNLGTEIKEFQLSRRIVRRDTIGAVKSQVECCYKRGAPTGTAYVHMCSACTQTTEFSEDTFPRYTNEVTCDPSDCNCFTVQNTAHGMCVPIIRYMKMLKKKSDGCRMVIKNGQQLLVDDWELYDQPLHVGCECMFKKNSLFATFIPLT